MPDRPAAPDAKPAKGLTREVAAARLAEVGPNRLPDAPPTPFARRVLDAMRSPLVLLLWAAAALDLTAWALEGRHGAPFETIAILSIVLLNAGLEVSQGWRAERALAELAALATPHAEVWRDGRRVRRPTSELVPGDRVRLPAGTRVPADGRLLEATGATLDTSALTGESVPETRTVGDDVAAGTTLVAGRAEMEVTATGPDSAMGRLATLLGGIDRSATPLQRRMEAFGRRVAWAAAALAAAMLAAGWALGGDPVDTLLLAVALAVAAVPEGLPAVMTGALALGTQRMARRNAVVRRLAAVETLGSVDVVAADKTGTLTRNRMRLARLVTPDGDLDVAGEVGRAALRAGVLASDAPADGETGDPIERAWLDGARDAGLDPAALRRDAPRTDERPFDAAWSFLRATVRDPERDGAEVSYLKGAPEALLARCALGDDDRAAWAAANEARAEAGERTLLVARGAGRAERDLTPLALVAFRDPPRAGAADAVAAARRAGARVVMITGDHPATARAVAREVGLDADVVAVGDAVAERRDAGTLREVDVFARTAPERKLDIVEAYQAAGATVAMTGDGVNDAPALRRADVGVAMGERGSDVAREAADVVLLDDDVSTLIAAIREGRGVAANLRAFVRFLFAANAAEVVTIATGFVLALAARGGDAVPPLAAAQILWINLITDALPALALAWDRRPGLMDDPPHAADAPLLSASTLRFVGFGGGAVAALSLAPRAWAPWVGVGPEAAATATFMVLVLAQLALLDGARRERHPPTPNRGLWAALAFSGALQVAAVGLPPLRTLLGLAPLPLAAVPWVLGSAGVAWAVGRAVAAWSRPKDRA
ncbi:MAG: cation-transporting P-type ATPase [Trueperaceae bacterium]|nr:cation-transporting P-type ATPase [Trueperaceae bacterium]